MKRFGRTVALQLCLTLLTWGGAIAVQGAQQDEGSQIPIRSTRRPLSANPTAGAQEKLIQIQANQEAIRKLLDEILIELGHAKTRATTR